ncbi:hypothetical protein ACN469_05460 [Corallococcus terminator]
MESTTRAKPKILYKGAATGPDFNTLKDMGEVFVTDGLEQAEVLWVDCATTKPDQYGHLLKAALDTGKTLVMDRLDPLSHEAVSRVVGTRMEDSVATLMVSRDPRAATPSSYALTVLGAASTALPPEQSAPPHLERDTTRKDWGKLLESHRALTPLDVGGPGLIPPRGVMYGIRTTTRLDAIRIRNPGWPATQGKVQTFERGFRSSFYVYRENGKANADYVVIRVQQATVNPGPLMVNTNQARGYWQYGVSTECAPNRGVPLLGTSPATTNGPGFVTQLSVPMHVRYLQDGACLPNHWLATHGPIVQITDGWSLANQSELGPGTASWDHFHRDPWDSLYDTMGSFDEWGSTRYEGIPPRVKNLSLLAGTHLTVENAAAWRFSATDIATHPQVTFREILQVRLVAFATATGSGTLGNQVASDGLFLENSITLDLPQITEDITNPCR